MRYPANRSRARRPANAAPTRTKAKPTLTGIQRSHSPSPSPRGAVNGASSACGPANAPRPRCPAHGRPGRAAAISRRPRSSRQARVHRRQLRCVARELRQVATPRTLAKASTTGLRPRSPFWLISKCSPRSRPLGIAARASRRQALRNGTYERSRSLEEQDPRSGGLVPRELETRSVLPVPERYCEAPTPARASAGRDWGQLSIDLELCRPGATAP